MSDLGTAIAITSEAFKKTTDKGGKPYILHCLHVMNKMKYMNDEELMIIAVLHDLVEDTSWTFCNLKDAGFSSRVINALMKLTHKQNEEYGDYIGRVSTNKDAILVKLQDLRHNSDVTRMKGIRKKDLDRIEKYHKAYNYLKNLDQP